MGIEELFDRVAARLLEEDPSLSRGRIFRAEGVRNAAGRFVAFVADGDLVLKLPEARVTELVAVGDGRPFAAGTRVMREWVRVRPRDETGCRAYVDEARAFASA